MYVCAAENCTSKFKDKEKGVTFHRFPKDPYLQSQWIKNVCPNNWKPSPESRLCSKHFTRNSFQTFLKNNAVPLHKMSSSATTVSCLLDHSYALHSDPISLKSRWSQNTNTKEKLLHERRMDKARIANLNKK